MSDALDHLLTIQKQIKCDEIALAKIQGRIASLREKLLLQFPKSKSIKDAESRLRKKQEETNIQQKRFEKAVSELVSAFKRTEE